MTADQYIAGISDPEKKALYDFFRTADSEAAERKVRDIWKTTFPEK